MPKVIFRVISSSLVLDTYLHRVMLDANHLNFRMAYFKGHRHLHTLFQFVLRLRFMWKVSIAQSEIVLTKPQQ